METGEGGSESFVVTAEPAKAGQPGEGAFDDPAPGQQHEAAFGFRQFDHDQVDTFLRGLGGCFGAGVALIDIADLHVLFGRGLDLRGEIADLRPFLGVGGGHLQGQQMTEGIDRDMDLGTFAPLCARRSRPAFRSPAWIARCARRG